MLDYAFGATSFVMPNVLAKLGADILGINPNVSTVGVIGFDRDVHAARLVELVRSSGANLGRDARPRRGAADPGGRHGPVLDDDEALLALELARRLCRAGQADRRAG